MTQREIAEELFRLASELLRTIDVSEQARRNLEEAVKKTAAGRSSLSARRLSSETIR